MLSQTDGVFKISSTTDMDIYRGWLVTNLSRSSPGIPPLFRGPRMKGQLPVEIQNSAPIENDNGSSHVTYTILSKSENFLFGIMSAIIVHGAGVSDSEQTENSAQIARTTTKRN